MVISECIWQGWKVDECEEGFIPLAVYIMLASCVAGAVLKAKWEITDISCSQTTCASSQCERPVCSAICILVLDVTSLDSNHIWSFVAKSTL